MLKPPSQTKTPSNILIFFLNYYNVYFFDCLFLTFLEPWLNYFISRLLFSPLSSLPFFWSPRGDSNPAPSGSQQKLLTARPTGTHVIAGWKHGPYYPKKK